MKNLFIVLLVFVVLISLFVGVYADSGDDSLTLVEWVKLIFQTLFDTFKYFTDLGPDGFIADIWESLKTGFNNIGEDISNLGTTLKTKFNSVIQWCKDINETLANMLRPVLDWFSDLNETISDWFRSAVNWLRDINSSIVTKLSSLGEKVVNLGPTITNKVQSLIDKIQNLFFSDKTVDSSIVDDVVGKEDDVNNSISSDLQSSNDYYNQVYNILFGLGSALSAVTLIFNIFVNIPFFTGLVYVSISIGIISALLGLAGLVGKGKE